MILFTLLTLLSISTDSSKIENYSIDIETKCIENNNENYRVEIAPPALRVCPSRTKGDCQGGKSMNYEMSLRLLLSNNSRTLITEAYLRVFEEDGDFSDGYGKEEQEIYTAPLGMKISNVLLSSSSWSYGPVKDHTRDKEDAIPLGSSCPYTVRVNARVTGNEYCNCKSGTGGYMQLVPKNGQTIILELTEE